MNLKKQFILADIEHLKKRKKKIEGIVKRQQLIIKGVDYKIRHLEGLLG